MSFVNTHFLFYAIGGSLFIAILLNRMNANYFKWVKSYWFFERTWSSRLSSFFYILSLFLLMLSLLDLRGPEKKIKANIPDQRTIILIDSSSSMLAEDVRPNRFVKSLQIARHFVKNAPGHQISIVLFSDVQKRLIPFTDDIDLIDSRLAGLEKTNSVAGGSNISQAIEEASQYFEFDANGDDKSKSGNMLVFTDAEESEGEFKVHLSSNINLAVVGVGTLKGGNIPLRWEDGSFKGYKNFKGEPVITKLDENYIKKMGKNARSFKYWIVNSYSLPTEEIMNFFRSAYNKSQNVGDQRIRPVFSHLILIPAIILYCLSVIIGRFAIFKMGKQLSIIFLAFCGLYSFNLKAQDDVETPKPKVEISPEIKKDLEHIKSGEAKRDEILKTAEKFLKSKDSKNASELYSEYGKKDDSEAVRFNYATSLLSTNRQKEAMPIIQELLKNSKDEDLKDKLRQNLRKSIDQKAKDEQKKKEDQKNKDNKKDDQKDNKEDQKNKGNDKDKKDKDNSDQKKQGNQGDQKNQGKQDEKKDKPQGKDGKQDNQQKKGNDKDQKEENKKDEKKDGKDKDKNKDKGKGEEKEEEEKPQGPSTLEEKEKEIEQKRKMVKTPAMIKQIMSDDRDLQKRMMDTSTNERGQQKPKRDW